ncbi:hypothetical protein [Clostridium sp. JN-9]|uniref:putative ABC transporter permease subunit n=1 Tax=Clostridium sp. JN-9 TaxID=2507159 RepID=UPI0013E8A809|nr:hypothetical protein [Clostridium sp. JN-9]
MNKFIILTKFLLKGYYGSFSSGKRKNRVGYIILQLAVLTMFAFFSWMINSALFKVLSMYGMTNILAGINYSLVSFVIFFFGVFYVMNIFYFSRDTDYLLPLPVAGETIVMSKFTVTIVYEYSIVAVILLPFTIIYGIGSGSGLIYWIYSIIGMMLIPVIPITIALLLSIIIMPFVNMSKNKDMFKTIAGIVGVFFALAFNFFMQSAANKFQNSKQLADTASKISNTTSSLFPGSGLISNAIINYSTVSGFMAFILFILVTVITLVLAYYMGKLLYLKGVAGLSESSSKRKKINKGQFAKTVVKSSAMKTYFLKEVKILFRTPPYFINCILPNFLWPIFMILPFIANKSNGASEDQLKLLFEMIRNSSYSGKTLAFSAAAGIFFGAANCVTPTAISREGNSLFFMKYIPLSYTKQLLAKVFSGILVSFIGLSIILVLSIVFFRLSPLMILFMIIVMILSVIFTNIAGIILDLYFPKLNWDNEQKAVKQNFNTLICILAGFLLSALIIFLSFKLNLSVIAAFISITALFIVLDFALYNLLKIVGEKRLSELEK